MKDKMLFVEEVLNQFGESFAFERKVAENMLKNIMSNYIIEYKNSENSKKDLSEKIELYFECQAISKTINENSEYQYRLKLLKFANHVDKSVDSITTQDIRDFSFNDSFVNTSKAAPILSISEFKNAYFWNFDTISKTVFLSNSIASDS